MALNAQVLSSEAVKQMRFAYQFARRREQDAPAQHGYGGAQPLIEGVLIADLAAAANPLTGQTTAWVQRLWRNDGGDLELAGGATTTNTDHYFLLVNRATSLSLDALTYVICAVVNGEFRWVAGDCSPGEFTVGPGPNGASGGSIPSGGGASAAAFGGGAFGAGSFGS